MLHPWGFSPLNARESDLIAVDVTSNNTLAIFPGEPVIAQSDGSVIRTPAGSAAGAATDGITAIVVDILQYKASSGQVLQNGIRYLPAATIWTAHQDRSRLLVCLCTEDMRYQVKCATALASLAAGRSARFGNADHSYGTADNNLGLTGVQLATGTIDTTATRQWRILGVQELVGNDPLQANFIAEVAVNLPYGLPIVGHSATGL